MGQEDNRIFTTETKTNGIEQKNFWKFFLHYVR